MIPFELEYAQAVTKEEAVDAWSRATAAGKKAIYFGGGTEFVTMARESKAYADLLIDYKRVPEAQVLGEKRSKETLDKVHWGSAVRINDLVDVGTDGAGATRFRLLAQCGHGIADRTVRNSITLGGNIAGMLPFREAILPFLILDGEVETIGPTGERTTPVRERYDKRLLLEGGELILGLTIDRKLIDAIEDIENNGTTAGERSGRGDPGYGPVRRWSFGPRGGWFYYRHTKEPRLDYPLVTLVVAVIDDTLRVALTGAFGAPLRAVAAEEILNTRGVAGIASLDRDALLTLGAHALDAEEKRYKKDFRGGGEYRRAITTSALAEGLERLSKKGER